MLDNILTTLKDFIAEFLPFRMVQENEYGLRWTCGKLGLIAQGKFLWCIPLVQKIEVLDASLAALFPPVQCVSTLDNKAVAIRVGLEWKIVDARKFILAIGINDYNDILGVVVQSYVSNTMTKLKLEDIIIKQKTAETKITKGIAQLVEDYGIGVKRAHIVECVPIIPLKLFVGDK